ncbi:hypothetical protein K437DRAFT_257920 [Tilletiaria anomala UBC 951]|uniref:Uncharacterized protein n=1 Tax=Tilletiaria anomala (strain ATCC 24038 / CBS 436.72 / UBC 951) TaxID=1037660 RepID=A0A066VLE2_TILAU|nr:uncharacterized protein K437DRAFT_257920 [Tilletiaria anomala UBC 951]KDN42291.1 hypothetical protein K437DRAFT_257920 [Tilletiaria anomala UBC 951]
MGPPALEQLFTLPFALHLTPLPTLEYVVESKGDDTARRARRRNRRELKEALRVAAAQSGSSSAATAVAAEGSGARRSSAASIFSPSPLLNKLVRTRSPSTQVSPPPAGGTGQNDSGLLAGLRRGSSSLFGNGPNCGADVISVREANNIATGRNAGNVCISDNDNPNADDEYEYEENDYDSDEDKISSEDASTRSSLERCNKSASSSFDLAGGASRLRPVTTKYAPHSLDTISVLLEQTDLFSSIEALSKAMRMLDRASITRRRSKDPSNTANAYVAMGVPLDGMPSGDAVNRDEAFAHAFAASADVAAASSNRRMPIDEMDPEEEGLEKDIAFTTLRTFFNTRFNVTYNGERRDPAKPLYARLGSGSAKQGEPDGSVGICAHTRAAYASKQEQGSELLSSGGKGDDEGAENRPLTALRRTFSPTRIMSFPSSNGQAEVTISASGIVQGGTPLCPEGVSPDAKDNNSNGNTFARLGDAFKRARSMSHTSAAAGEVGVGTTRGGGTIRGGSRASKAKSLSKRKQMQQQQQQQDARLAFAQAQEAPHPIRVFTAWNDGRSCGAEKRRKDVHFNVRLDLHNVGLAPVPERVKAERALFKHSQKARRRPSHVLHVSRARSPSATSVEEGHVHHSGGDNSAFNGGMDLQTVISPASIVSSKSSFGATGVGGLPLTPSTSPAPLDVLAKARSHSPPKVRRGTSSSMPGVLPSDLFDEVRGGNSPTTSEVHESASMGVGKDRRPSFLLRVLDLGFKTRARSASGMSSGSNADSQGSGFAAFANPNLFSSDSAQSQSPSAISQDALQSPILNLSSTLRPPGSPMRSRQNAGSFGSASARMNARHFLEGSNLGAVQENTNFDDGDRSDALSLSDEAEFCDDLIWPDDDLHFDEGEDIVTLLRKAAAAALTIVQTRDSGQATPSNSPAWSEDGKGPTQSSATQGIPTSVRPRESEVGVLTPPGSIEPQRQHKKENRAFRLAEITAGCWLSGDFDPMTVAIASAFGHSLGWEGIMNLCYGVESGSSQAGDFIPLGRAAELHEQSKVNSANVLAWRSDVAASAGATPETRLADLPSAVADALDNDLDRLNPEAEVIQSEGSAESLGSWLKKLRSRLQGATSLPHRLPEVKEASGTGIATQRSWQHWLELFRSIAAWIDAFEETRVKAGLATEVGQQQTALVWTAPDGEGYNSLFAPSLLKDISNVQNPFRRRHGVPDGLPPGPDGDELASYRWSKQNLDARHFSTPLTHMCLSLEHIVSQLATQEWPHRSAWELDYLEMCVFHTPIIAHRFPPPSYKAVMDEQTLQPESAEERARANVCPMPSPNGVWSSASWRRWLSRVQEGQILVPAVAWQAWWTLIAILNGADRSGRPYDLQVKSYEEPFSVLTDERSVYL